jgi:hypothetical protein
MTSANKWLILGGLLTTLNLGWFLAEHLEAAPSDVKGSGNVAVSSYTTTEGTYILWSSGRITDSKSGEEVAPPYGPAPGFAKAALEKGTPVGSPRVAVDYVQNDEGTYTLFADGSVMKADDEGASAPAGGAVDIKFGVAMPNSLPPLENGIDMPDSLQASGAFVIEEPFEEGAIIIMPLKQGGVHNAFPTGMIGAYTVGPDGRNTGMGSSPNNINTDLWDGTWVIAIGK